MLGIDDGHSRDAGTGDDGGVTTGEGGTILPSDAGDAGDGATIPVTLPDGAPIPTGCENVTLAAGIFVAPNGSSDPSCGTAANPCGSIQTAINRAHDTSATPNVYVADGSYSEAITLKSGVTVIGGWTPSTTAAWTRDCNDRATQVHAPGGSGTAVTAAAFPSGGASKLSTLSIVSDDPSRTPGESLVGLSATGVNTSLSLVWVTITTGHAGDGAPGPAGDAGSAGGVCSSTGDAAPGSSVGTTGEGADAGVFTSTSFVPVSGQPGGPGGAGENGGPGTDAGCVTCVQCTGALCSPSFQSTACGSPGQPGCGGGGGGGGGGGAGGGSSVALFVWDATVHLSNTTLSAGAGGNGGAGGAGGPGGPGGMGMAGAPGASCAVKCTGVLTGCPTMSDNGAGGGAGGAGGAGAAGGVGGDGSGGDSFAIIEGGNGAVQVDQGSQLLYASGGTGGPDGGNGAPGRSGSEGP